MITIISLRCGEAFAPYLIDGFRDYLEGEAEISRVFRQAASGLIIRSVDGLIVLRHQGREVVLDRQDARHYLATVRMHSEFYDALRTSDEVVVASLGDHLLLSHPQSELWLPGEILVNLLDAFDGPNGVAVGGLPDWLTISGGDGRLLLSDQRNGRWVLLGADHREEFERRLEQIKSARPFQTSQPPPTVWLKGVALHLQSAFKMAEALESFAEANSFVPFEEMSPTYVLGVARTSEGMQIVDSNLKIAITPREARKWAAIIRDELEKRNARQTERGRIRTVFADNGPKGEPGRWILQWGDEILLSPDELSAVGRLTDTNETARLVIKQDNEFRLILEKSTGNCVALTKDELDSLI